MTLWPNQENKRFKVVSGGGGRNRTYDLLVNLLLPPTCRRQSYKLALVGGVMSCYEKLDKTMRSTSESKAC